MHPAFTVNAEEIVALNDTQARELVARLCKAEVKLAGQSESCVEWGGDQRAADGGIDVAVELPTTIPNDGFLPCATNGFQVKAESFPASKIRDEMMPKGVLRDSIRRLAKAHGSYLIVSTKDSCAKETALKNRLNAMSSVVGENETDAEFLTCRFYHNRKLADWAERHPMVVVWLKHAIGKPLTGWQPYSGRAYREDREDAEYLMDELARVVSTRTGKRESILEAISELRKLLLSNSSSIRIVGLSGVGKTRFVQALFDERLETDSAIPSKNSVIYADLADNPSPQPNVLVEQLIDKDGIIIVDNCGSKSHNRLAEILKKANSNLRLVTVEYDIRDDLSEGTQAYRIDPSSNHIITRIVSSKYGTLSNSDIEKTVKFAGGNARIAMAMASTVESQGEISQLRDEELFERLFYQRHEKSQRLLRSAEACSLVYSFDVDATGADSELAILADFAGISTVDLYRDITELFRRGLVQARGQWRAVLPHAIANRLGARALSSIPQATLIETFLHANVQRIGKSLARRLSYLYDCQHVQKLVTHLLSPEGQFGDLSNLHGTNREIFDLLACVNEKVALDVLTKGFKAIADDQIANYKYSFSNLIRSLAYDTSNFDNAIKLLVRFETVTHDDDNSRSSDDTVSSLFYCMYSGTNSTPEQRFKIVESLVFSESLEEQRVGRDFLEAALKTEEFQNFHGNEFGGKIRDYGWMPESAKDTKNWFRLFLELASKAGSQKTVHGRLIREVVADALFGIWKKVGLTSEITEVARLFKGVDGWASGWLATRRLLAYSEDLDANSREKLETVCKSLEPDCLATSIRARVLSNWWYHLADEAVHEKKASWEDYHDEIRSVGNQSANDLPLLTDLMPDLLTYNHSNFVWTFGEGVGQSVADIMPIFVTAKKTLGEDAVQMPDLKFLHALFSEWAKRNSRIAVGDFLDWMLNDTCFGNHFPTFQCYTDFDDSAFDRMEKSLELGLANANQFCVLPSKRPRTSFSKDQMATLLARIANMKDGQLAVAEILSSLVIHTGELSENFKKDLTGHCFWFLQQVDNTVFDSYRVGQTPKIVWIAGFVVPRIEEREALALLDRYLTACTSGRHSGRYCRGRYLEPFFEHYTNATLNAIYLIDDDGENRLARRIALGEDRERGQEPIFKAPVESVIKWCGSNHERILFAIAICPIFVNCRDESGQQNPAISNFAQKIFSFATEKQAVLEKIVDRISPRSWSGSRATIIRNRTNALNCLRSLKNQCINSLIDKTQSDLRELADEYEQWEEERDRDHNERFE
ncbi:MAG: hypothetical protein R3C03_04005 [Pirellulaceae bacterium]